MFKWTSKESSARIERIEDSSVALLSLTVRIVYGHEPVQHAVVMKLTTHSDDGGEDEEPFQKQLCLRQGL